MKDDVTIAKCPGCKSDAIVAGVGLITEFGPMTYSQVQCGQSTTGCGYKGPYGHDPDHAIRLHNLLCHPAEDGLAREAVAWTLMTESGAFSNEGLKLWLVRAHAEEISAQKGGIVTPLYRSPPLEPPREMTQADNVPKGYEPDNQYAWKAGWNACVGYMTGKRELTQDVADLLKSARGTKT
jgi:hypothetical protein